MKKRRVKDILNLLGLSFDIYTRIYSKILTREINKD